MSRQFKRLDEVGPGFWNIRGDFKILLGTVNIGTHMAICKLESGRYLVLDTIQLDPELKKEIDMLTNGGQLIEAVIGTHPFHTLYFKDFYKSYPDLKYFGTPRHLATIKEIPWVGETMQCSCRWQPEVEMRKPAGSEYVDPKPPRSNHFCNVFVFHKASRTVFNDDCVLCFKDPGFLMRMVGIKNRQMMFHPSMKGPGLYPTEEAPGQFSTWVSQLIQDWDFDNMCTAHNGNCIGGARKKLAETLISVGPVLLKIKERNARKVAVDDVGSWNNDDNAPECG